VYNIYVDFIKLNYIIFHYMKKYLYILAFVSVLSYSVTADAFSITGFFRNFWNSLFNRPFTPPALNVNVDSNTGYPAAPTEENTSGFDGTWTGSLRITSGACMPVTFTTNISKGYFKGTGSDGGVFGGVVGQDGSLVGTSGIVDFRGSLSGNTGSGTGEVVSDGRIVCRGTFTMKKSGTTSTNTGSTGGVNVNVGGGTANVGIGTTNTQAAANKPVPKVLTSGFDGTWTGSLRITGGACTSVTFTTNISKGYFKGTGSDGGVFGGVVGQNGSLVGTSGLVNFRGTLSGNTGSGTGEVVSDGEVICTGTFTMKKSGTTTTNTNTGSTGGVNVNVGGGSLEVTTDTDGAVQNINSGKNDILDGVFGW
jgi:hypothetical protein